LLSFSIASAKVDIFLKLPKHIRNFLQKKMIFLPDGTVSIPFVERSQGVCYGQKRHTDIGEHCAPK
jgi:hypothetical protein